MLSYQNFINESESNILRIEAENILIKKGAYQNEDGTWSCDEDLFLNNIDELSNNGKLLVEFKEIKGVFNCSDLKLTTLEGCPTKIDGSFIASYNKLTNLNHGPKIVSMNYSVNSNHLTSLKGSPILINGSFNCNSNKLKDLIGAPERVKDLHATNNPYTSLEGIPKFIGNNFWYTTEHIPFLKYEGIFMKSIENNNYKIEGDYWVELLKYTLKINPDFLDNINDLKDAVNWPNGFLTDELVKSLSTINKFKL